MRFVLDASIVITWAMRDEDHPLADLAFLEIQSGSAVVPGIWWFEIRNILVLNERRNRISPDDSNRFLLALEQLSIDIDLPLSGTEVMELSRKYKLSVYDAAYLALAMRERLPLATLDKALQSAAQAAGVPLL
ncbi:MAG TPA: type II toxin-antitoxin system VapC family toxin [Terracidiphilus sp.]|jgi:predicted nucleic acid-binding protein|nr:type II toxin-antitoxin system VapC family toxin [Terracidiphilus sp.]